jgi:hypothetical protein
MKSIKMMFVLIVLASLMPYPAAAKKDTEKDLLPGFQRKVDRSEEHPQEWQHRQYRKGEILDRQTCDQSFIVEPENIKGVIGIKVGDKVLRVIRSTREIVDIIDGK